MVKLRKSQLGLLQLFGLAIAFVMLVGTVSVQAQSPQNLDTITIGPRFSPNPLEVRGMGGGSLAVADVVGRTNTPTGACVGFADTKANQTIELTAFFESLSLVVQSTEDTALAIKGPGGIWCNDDYQGKNPGISGQWLPGTYQVWIGSYAQGRSPSYVLRLTETR